MKTENMKKIMELVDIEIDEGSHDDYIENYNSKLDFYLSNVLKDSYITHFLPLHFDNLNESELIAIQEKIIEEINNRIED